MKNEALDLPDRTFKGVDFKRPTSYIRLATNPVDENGELIESAPALVHALRQTLTTKDKLDYLSTILEGTRENVVIFYNYNSEREAILELLEKKHSDKTVFRQDGQKHELPGKESWAGIENSVTLGHYKSASTGVEMTYATIVVYFSPTYRYDEHMQSIGRVYRNGQTQKTTFYNFRTPGTIESDVWEYLKSKSDFQSEQWLINNKEIK